MPEGSDEPIFSFGDFAPQELRRRGSIKWNRYEPDVLACWVAEMDFSSAPAVRAAVEDAARRQEFGYPKPDQLNGLPQAVAGFQHDRYGWNVDPLRVHTLPDVLRGVELGIRLHSPESSAVVLPTPAYMPFFDLPAVTRRPIIEVPCLVDDDGFYALDLEGIDAAFRGGARTLVLCNPHNPVGRSLSAEELRSLSEVVDRHGGRVVADEIHAPLTYPGHEHTPYAGLSAVTASHTVTATSASKGWNLPGLKCAHAILSNEVDQRRWETLTLLETHGASTFGIAANLAAYREGVSWLDAAVEYLDGNRRLLGELLASHLPLVGYVPPQAGYLAWLDCRNLELGVEPSDFFLSEARVATNPGTAFGAPGAGYVRFNFATSQTLLEQAVTAMGRAVSRRR